MRVTLVALVCGAVVAASSAQAGPTLTKAIPNEAGAAPPVELVHDGCGHPGIGPAGVTNGDIGIGVTAFLMEVPTGAGARGGTIPRHIGAVLPHHGVGVIHSVRMRARTSLVNEFERRAVKTATDRAAEAIEAAETMFADEMGATLDLSPAAKAALISKISAAIEAAVVEERQRLARVL